MDHKWIDGTLYPDIEVPTTLETLAERVDFPGILDCCLSLKQLQKYEKMDGLLQLKLAIY